jgi:hypothetical protein
MIRSACLLVCLLLVYTSVEAAVVPIEDIKQIDANGEIRLDLLGKVFTVAGVVTVPSGRFNTADLDIYIQDHTAGINVTRTGAGNLQFALGDSVVVTGRLDQFRGNTLLRLEAESDIKVVGRGTVPKPVVVTAADLSARPEPPLELYEGKLVMVEAASFNQSDWPAAGLDKRISASDATGSFQFNIDKDTDIDGSPPPRQPTIIIGVVIQDDTRYPFLQGYVVWPRSRYGDFYARGNGSGVASIVPDVVDTETESFDLELTLGGNRVDTLRYVSIDLPLADGWGWDGSAENVEISGPGFAGASVEVTESGCTIEGAAVLDADKSYGKVVFRNLSAPSVRVESEIDVRTSLDGIDFVEVSEPPVLKALYPTPDVVINEVYPHDGTTAELNSFIELRNMGTQTAHLEGLALSEQRPVTYCSPGIKYVFGASDSISAGGYLVLVASLAGFEARFGLEPPLEQAPVVAPISPLGRVEGDGGTCGSARKYELIALWRDDTLRELVAHMEYADATVCTTGLCSGFGGAFPCIPPLGYSLLYGTYDPCCPYEVLTSDPTPGAANVVRYAAPVVEQVKSYNKRTVEVTFNEPMDASALEDPSHYTAEGHVARSARASVSREKVLVLFPEMTGTGVNLGISGVPSMPGVALRDTSLAFTLSPRICPSICEIQSSDDQGFSPFGGQTVCTSGFITVPPGVFQPDYSSIYIQGLDGCGVNVFSYDVPQPVPVVGDFVTVTGEVTDYVSGGGAGATTEIFMSAPTALTIESRGYPEPEPLVLSTAEVSQEINEGKFIETEGAVIEADSIASFYIDDGSGGIQVYQNYTPIDFTKYEPGMYVKVRGVVLQYDYTAPFFEGYELVPRYLSDIQIIGEGSHRKAFLDVEARVFCPACGEESFSIDFSGPDRSSIVVRIFDGAGRDVTTIYDGTAARTVSLKWDGRDRRGKRVPPGLYIVYLECVEEGTSRTVTDSAPIVVGMELR